MTERHIREIRRAHPSRDGDGVAIQRIAGMQHAGMDPILMIDELRSERRQDFIGGFPPHPHRGMQTLTYLLAGGIIHEDNQGNRGEIRGGGAQWMSAGRGIIHSEMPTVDSRGLHGFQLWVNLPRAEKMSAPRYRDVPATELATLEAGSFRATAIAGHWDLDGQALQGPLTELAAQASVLDLVLAPGGAVTLRAPATESVMGYVYEGGVRQGDTLTGPQHLLVTGPGDRWTLAAGADGLRLLVLRGEPLREPVAQYGPFVMNTAQEIEQAIRDYRNGQFA
jgi:redox-sensitive bicupin YhaK (pirin superfamily)